MNSRERLQATLRHEEPDRVCVDMGATPTSGIHVAALTRLRRAVLGEEEWRAKVIEPYQMLGEVDDALRQALGIDTAGVCPPKTLFGFANENWKPFTLFDGVEVLVPGDFNVTEDANGDLLIYPEGDLSAPPSGRMPCGGHFFDSIIRQPPLDEDRLDPADNCQEFAPLNDDDIDYFRREAERLATETEYGIVMVLPGAGFGDIALVPAPWMKHPRGIRDVEEWYVSLAARPDYVRAVFERQCDVALDNIARLAEAVGDLVDVVFVTGTDFGSQRGLFSSPDSYRRLFKPFHRRVNDLIHQRTNWATFIHSCGAVSELIPDFIDAGFQVLNPVQCSAAGMEPQRLKREFGQHIVFWGGGVDTQRTLPFGSPDDVRREVAERIAIFGEGGGFVFNTVHNIQADTPLENMLAMFDAIRESTNA